MRNRVYVLINGASVHFLAHYECSFGASGELSYYYYTNKALEIIDFGANFPPR
jgi:hypothetical protein